MISAMKVKVFTVFHRAIDERLIFDLFTPSEVESYFTLYGTNLAHPQKQITKLDGQTRLAGPDVSNLLLEYQLPWHDPLIQERGFLEASAYVHLYKNAIHESLDYIGIAQYDMRWTAPGAEILRDLARAPADGSNIVYGFICGILMNPQGQLHPLAFPIWVNWAFLLYSYNRFFNRNWEAQMLINKPFTLFQTYLLPKNEFADLAAWITVLCEELYPWANQPPYRTHWGHLAGCVERAESLFIAARLAENRITLKPLPLLHDTSIVKKLAVTKDHYG
jgi:hypothetical protein